jgi:flavin-binding protein dodecin
MLDGCAGAPERPPRAQGELVMSGTVARITNISARSDTSFEDAVRTGVERAASTLRNVSGAWVKDQKVDVQDGRIVAWQVVLEVTFVLE